MPLTALCDSWPVVAPMPTDPGSSLQPLFARLEQGDPAAVNDILAHCQGRLVALTRRTLREFPGVRRWGDTSDVYGEASFRLIKALRDVRFTNPNHFLCVAATHIRLTLIDLTRKKKLGSLPARGGGDDEPDPAGDPADDPGRLAMWEEFHAVVASLPAADHQLFELLFYQGLSLPDASGLLGVPLQTLKCRWRDARANFMLRFGNQSPV